MTTTRRTFLGTAAASAVAVASDLKAAEPAKPLRLGVIGVGWYGMVDAKAALKAGGVEIAAICDVDATHLAQSAAALGKLQDQRPRTFKLYEEMLAQVKLDAVIIATPPHWHALQLMASLAQGLDVYCEKPLAYDLREGRAMVDAVRRSGRIVQVGFQRRQSPAFQQVREFIASGELGRIVQADVQIHYNAGASDPAPCDPPPALDWNLWCGPAPMIPYSKAVGHMSWRLEKTTGHGHLVDWGIHNIDAARLMLGLGMPGRITADGGIYHHQGLITTPDTLSVHFEFAELPVVWRHRLWGALEGAPEYNNGVFLYGEKGSIFATDQKWTVFRKQGNATAKEEFPARADLGLAHMTDFLDAVRTRRQPSCTIEDAFRTTATVQLAMIAQESASVVRWDEATGQIAGNPAAAKLLRRDYRQPWIHPGDA